MSLKVHKTFKGLRAYEMTGCIVVVGSVHMKTDIDAKKADFGIYSNMIRP